MPLLLKVYKITWTTTRSKWPLITLTQAFIALGHFSTAALMVLTGISLAAFVRYAFRWSKFQ